MGFNHFLDWLQGTPIAVAIRENEILFPWIESVHVLAIVLVVGTISIVDLRLIGVASRNRPVTTVMREMLPYTWTCFVVPAITAALEICTNSPKYATHFFSHAKRALLD